MSWKKFIRQPVENQREDESYKAEALEATHQLQMGNRGYRALWKHILQVSVTDLKKNYANLNVDFNLWNGESDVQDTIAPMVQKLKDQGLAYEDQGAVVVDVKEETDTKEVPPCMILKSDGCCFVYNHRPCYYRGTYGKLYNPDEDHVCGRQTSGACILFRYSAVPKKQVW